MFGRIALPPIGILLLASSAWGVELRDSVVKIHSSHRAPDFLRPWTKAPARQTNGSGVIIAGQQILTNAHVVQYSSRLLVQGHQSTARIAARVVAFAPEMDLALLELFPLFQPFLPLLAVEVEVMVQELLADLVAVEVLPMEVV